MGRVNVGGISGIVKSTMITNLNALGAGLAGNATWDQINTYVSGIKNRDTLNTGDQQGPGRHEALQTAFITETKRLYMKAPDGKYGGGADGWIGKTEADLIPANIKAGVDIFGVLGNAAVATTTKTKTGIAREPIASGTLVERYKGGIRNAWRKYLERISIPLGVDRDYNGPSMEPLSITDLGDGRFLHVWGGNPVSARLYKENADGSVTVGATVTLTGFSANEWSRCFKLSDGTVLVAARWGASAVKFVKLTCTDVTITQGSVVSNTVSYPGVQSMIQLTTDKFVYLYTNSDVGSYHMFIVNASGAITFGTEVVVAASGNQYQITTTSTNRILAIRLAANYMDLEYRFYDESGNALTFNTSGTVTGYHNATYGTAYGYFVLMKHSDGVFSTGHMDSNQVSGAQGRINCFTVSGVTITKGTHAVVNLYSYLGYGYWGSEMFYFNYTEALAGSALSADSGVWFIAGGQQDSVVIYTTFALHFRVLNNVVNIDVTNFPVLRPIAMGIPKCKFDGSKLYMYELCGQSAIMHIFEERTIQDGIALTTVNTGDTLNYATI